MVDLHCLFRLDLEKIKAEKVGELELGIVGLLTVGHFYDEILMKILPQGKGANAYSYEIKEKMLKIEFYKI